MAERSFLNDFCWDDCGVDYLNNGDDKQRHEVDHFMADVLQNKQVSLYQYENKCFASSLRNLSHRWSF